MEKGAADKSYGIHVAKLAGLPDKLLERADNILVSLESKDKTLNHSDDDTKNTNSTDNYQLELFKQQNVSNDEFDVHVNEQNPVLEEIKQADLMSLTPMDVMNLVYKWKQEINK